MAGKQKCTEEILASWDMNNAKEPENLQISSTILWLWVNHDGPITDRSTQLVKLAVKCFSSLGLKY